MAAVPEARLNLVIYLLRRGDVDAAAALVEDLDPSQPQVCCSLLP